ncbi:hypothetical protein PROFUN_01875 [Planoprotostelium fungivorum]|uniref:Uncharacterized protein n=1 Tax=Planoprotostelium fungivorum TaxID=1890364 RepID=A0A2P6NYX6_9EUKA|nr:hypothetical protein PROFUN_01875 [Planoprotostelium fungivorum]
MKVEELNGAPAVDSCGSRRLKEDDGTGWMSNKEELEEILSQQIKSNNNGTASIETHFNRSSGERLSIERERTRNQADAVHVPVHLWESETIWAHSMQQSTIPHEDHLFFVGRDLPLLQGLVLRDHRRDTNVLVTLEIDPPPPAHLHVHLAVETSPPSVFELVVDE